MPEHDLLVGGFPCQDYSVAKTLSQARASKGRRASSGGRSTGSCEDRRPRFVFLENVDRLLKSPATQRGRDFAIILACLSDLGYQVEWRVVNAADYGFPQRRRRVFIVGRASWLIVSRVGGVHFSGCTGRRACSRSEGVAVRRCRCAPRDAATWSSVSIRRDHGAVRLGNKVTPFQNAGVMWDRRIWTRKVEPNYDGKHQMLGECSSRRRGARVVLHPQVADPAMGVPQRCEA